MLYVLRKRAPRGPCCWWLSNARTGESHGENLDVAVEPETETETEPEQEPETETEPLEHAEESLGGSIGEPGTEDPGDTETAEKCEAAVTGDDVADDVGGGDEGGVVKGVTVTVTSADGDRRPPPPPPSDTGLPTACDERLGLPSACDERLGLPTACDERLGLPYISKPSLQAVGLGLSDSLRRLALMRESGSVDD